MPAVLPRLLLISFALAACGDDAPLAECTLGERSLHLTAPIDGAMLTMADDTDPGMDLLQVDFRAHGCGIDSLAQVGIYMLEPTATDYAFTEAGDGNIVFTDVTLIPGPQRFEIRSVEAMPVIGNSISIDVDY
jgi:hypothetical protein